MKIESLLELRLLVETARAGSLSAAGRVLALSPATASAALKRLEARLDTRLVERSTRALRLTPEGALLLDYATRALELLAEGEAQLSEGGTALAGTVRLAAPSDLTRSVLLPWIDEFLALHPRVQVALSVSDRVQDVMRDAVDVALRYGELSDSRLVARTLCRPHRVLCAAPAYIALHGKPKLPQDLQRHNCLSFHVAGQRHLRWRFVRKADGEAVEVRVDGDRGADDAAIAHQWALAGAGLVYKSGLDVAHDLREGRLVRLLRGWEGEPYTLNAVLPSNRFVPARVRALVDFLAGRLAALEASS